MKILLILAVLLAFVNISAIEAVSTNVDEVTFIQYLDENTALEEVRNGNLDLYYYRISSDRIENAQSREGLKVYESTGGSYSMLVNPAKAEKFNPFSIKEARFALNYLIDRKLIVNELMGGYGVPMISNYGPFDPAYLTILNELEGFQFRYNPKLADQMITDVLLKEGAQKIDGMWVIDEEPIQITIFIRSDDPIRKSIGEIFASELKDMGFTVNKDFGDLNKAFVVVYGSDPADLKWNLYTEGWGGRAAFVRYDSIGLAQMYAPWFSNMPGFNDPTYWNYENDTLDDLTQKIYTGNFTTSAKRDDLIQKSTTVAINESVRIFLASKIDQYVVNENVSGVINDFGAGVPTRFTPINAQGIDESLVIGVKQLYQGAWNPVRGLTDIYSTHIWNAIADPATFKHPFTGNTIPVRAQWDVETAGVNQSIEIPNDAIIWNPETQRWDNVIDGKATSKVTFDLKFSNWHNGEPMDIYDILNSVYFTLEWGSTDNDKTVDTEYTPQAAQIVSTLVGVKPINETRIEVYVDYWHFDEAEIADWAAVWSTMPWEVYAAMEQSVIDGKVAFSRSEAVSKNINWLSLLVPNDSEIIKDTLQRFKDEQFVPNHLNLMVSENYAQKRYDSSIAWIDTHNHAIISNGPFYLKSYSPESRTITIMAFDDDTYPFQKGHWSSYEQVSFPEIIKVNIPAIINNKTHIQILTQDASEIKYFTSNADGIINSDSIKVDGKNTATIVLSKNNTQSGTNNIKIFAVSQDVLRPDFYASSFIVSDDIVPDQTYVNLEIEVKTDDRYHIIIFILAIIAIIGFMIYRKNRIKINHNQMQ